MTSLLRPSLTIVEVLSRAQWRAWLQANHATSTGVWAVTVKKAALTDRDEYVSAVDLNEECLCFGWIDSKPGKVDQGRTALLCTPRKPGSGWSKVNKDSTRRGILEWIAAAKTETTRVKRIDQTARLAQRNERANQWPRR